MPRICNRKLADRIRNAEQRLTLIRLEPGPIAPMIAEVEQQLQRQVSADVAVLAVGGYNKYGVKVAK